METTKISLSKGVYGLIKDHLKSNNKLSEYNRSKLEHELKYANVIPAKSIPDNIVSINTSVQVKDTETSELLSFGLVAPTEAKIKNNKVSILSAIGLALLGYRVGDEVSWEMPEGIKTYKIEEVSGIE